jgi:hypothetical protein
MLSPTTSWRGANIAERDLVAGFRGTLFCYFFGHYSLSCGYISAQPPTLHDDLEQLEIQVRACLYEGTGSAGHSFVNPALAGKMRGLRVRLANKSL